MSLQNALKLIQRYREDRDRNLPTIKTLNELVEDSVKEELPCSLDELKKAFQIEWDMRWLKHITKNS